MKRFAYFVSLLLSPCIPALHAPLCPAPVRQPEIAAAPKPLSRAEVAELIETAAAKHKLPPEFVQSIVAAESAFRSDAVSDKGALGLMQVMPATALDFGLDAANPAQNVEAGTKYLAQLVARYRNRCRNWMQRAIAAYNAGPGNVDKYRGVPPFRETRTYVKRVLAFMKQYRTTRVAFLNKRCTPTTPRASL